jgi:hypothetical protein
LDARKILPIQSSEQLSFAAFPKAGPIFLKRVSEGFKKSESVFIDPRRKYYFIFSSKRQENIIFSAYLDSTDFIFKTLTLSYSSEGSPALALFRPHYL